MRARHGAAIVGLALALRAAPAPGQTPYRVLDINTIPASFSPHGHVEWAGRAWFAATRGGAGEELWSSDGSAAGTFQVADLRPGPRGSAPERLAALPRGLLFLADDGINGREPWRSDGTAAGTALLADLVPGPAGLAASGEIVVLGGHGYFLALDAARTLRLFGSDGSAAGTRIVATLCGGCTPQVPKLVAAGGKLYFPGFEPATGWELWSSEGTSTGAALVADLRPGPDSGLSAPDEGQDLAGGAARAFFVADDGVSGRELWSSDGSPAGTLLARDIRPGREGTFAPGLQPLLVETSGAMLFLVDAGGGGWLWHSDGSPGGTQPLVSLGAPVGRNGTPARTLAGAAWFWIAGPDRVAVWRSDGTASGSREIAGFPKGHYGNVASRFALAAGTVYFRHELLDVSGERALWAVDPVDLKARRVADNVESGLGSPGVSELLGIGGVVLFAARDDRDSVQLWASDGSAAGTGVVAAFNDVDTLGSGPRDPAVLGDVLYFGAEDPGRGLELWRSDGSAAGTWPAVDTCPAPSPCGGAAVASGSRLLLAGESPGRGVELFHSDGTAAGTGLLADLCPGGCSSQPWIAGAGPTAAWLGALTDAPGTWLVRSDATAAGTSLAGPSPARGFEVLGQGVELDGTFVFAASDGQTGSELWRGDGSPSGTFLVADLCPGPCGSFPRDFVRLADALFFTAEDPAGGREPWWIAGSALRAERLADLCPGPCSSSPWALAAVGDRLLFAASDGTSGIEPWVSDGTAAGTRLLADLAPGPASSSPRAIAPYPGGALLFLDLPGAGLELWSTDGTGSGTRRVAPLAPAAGSFSPTVTRSAGRRVWFDVDDGEHGRELWSSDGTLAGTALLADIHPGSAGALDPGWPWLVRAGPRLYFAAADSPRNSELWALDLPGPGRTLLRNTALRSLDPPTPARATLLPLDPARDRHAELLAGETDPDATLLHDRSRPLAFYALDGPGVLRLARAPFGRIRAEF